jgi:hypothetical protein
MPDEKLEQVAERLSIADISSAIAFGLQRAIDARGDALIDKILIYGGRLDFHVQVYPQGAADILRETANVGRG